VRGFQELRTGDGRPLPDHLKAQIGRELDRLELALEQIKSVESERDAMLSLSGEGMPAVGAMLTSSRGIGPEFAGVLWSEGLFRSFSNRRQITSYAGLARTRRLKSGKPAAANNHDPTRLAVDKASPRSVLTL
jgi:transposase